MISHEHKCIFVHIPKTAGTSVEIALQGYPEPDDGVNGFNKHKTSRGYKNHNSDVWHNYYKFTIIRNPWDLMVSWWKWRSQSGHPYAQKKFSRGVKSASSTEERRSIEIQNFSKFLNSNEDVVPGNDYMGIKPGLTYFDYISDDTGIIVDKVCRFENLKKDFADVCKNLKLSGLELPCTNKTERAHYSNYYNDKLRKIVAHKFKREIKHFNYKFEFDT